MTATYFYSPTLITQVSVPNEITGIPSIDWNFNPTIIADHAAAVTKTGLYTISGMWMEKFLSNTSQLWCTQLGIPNRFDIVNFLLEDNTDLLQEDNVSLLHLEELSTSLFLQQPEVANSNGTELVQGIELLLDVKRVARIEDLVIQLTLNGQLIGDNLASTINPVQSDMYTGDFTTPVNPVGDRHIYGSGTDLWGTTGLTAANIADPTFGVVVSFKSNPIYPHKDLAYLSQVALRITYA